MTLRGREKENSERALKIIRPSNCKITGSEGPAAQCVIQKLAAVAFPGNLLDRNVESHP